MEVQHLRIGMIGGGSISDLHLQSFNENPFASISGICDLNVERAKIKANQYGAGFYCSDYKELLEQKDIDAIVICTWNHTHAEIAVEALQSGKHVLVEKPLSTNLPDAISVEKAVKKTGNILQVGFVRRFDSNVQILKRFIENGELGQIYYAKASSLRRHGNPGGWFSNKDLSGGGPLIDTGIHVIDTCWYLMGRPRPVSVSGNTYNSLGNRSNIENLSFYKAADYDAQQNNIEDLANAIIRFENGASLMLDASFTLHSKENETSIKLYGTHGGAEIEPEFCMIGERHDTILNIKPQTDKKGLDIKKAFRNQADHFVRSCLTFKQPLSSVTDGVEVMKIIAAIYESSEKQKEILL